VSSANSPSSAEVSEAKSTSRSVSSMRARRSSAAASRWILRSGPHQRLQYQLYRPQLRRSLPSSRRPRRQCNLRRHSSRLTHKCSQCHHRKVQISRQVDCPTPTDSAATAELWYFPRQGFCSSSTAHIVRIRLHSALTPNPSLKPTRYGRQRKPGLRHSVHHLSPGLRRLPPRSA
jgi:hypothetical protein